MLISKFDLCRSEWLELVFAKRNKEYGAYYLRQHYAGNMIKAMGITFLSITTAFIAGSMIMTSTGVVPVFHETVVPLVNVKPTIIPEKQQPAQPKASRPAKTTQFLEPVITTAPVNTQMPDVTAIRGPVGPATVNGPEVDVPTIDIPSETSGTARAAKPDVSIHVGAEIMPEPFGGAAGWSKFLQKNLRYPDAAIEAHANGKVWLSFIVEKDGQLSNIVVDKGAGYGMDEEALRVLKMSKAWKPGMQNGQPVRVRYTIPLNFVLNE